MWRSACIIGVLLSGCAQFPQVDAALESAEQTRADPLFLPFETFVSPDKPEALTPEDAALAARATDLRNRAAGLRAPVIDPATRARMKRGVTQP